MASRDLSPSGGVKSSGEGSGKRPIDWGFVGRRTLGAVFVLIGLAGVAVGFLRIFGDGDTMRGLADIIIGGFVALRGVGHWQEA